MRAWMAGIAGGLVLGAAVGAVAQDAGPGRVLARVAGVEITASDLERRLELMGGERPVPADRHGEVLRLLIREAILLRAAETAGIEREPGVQARMELGRRQILIEELLKRKMASVAQVSEEELQRAYRENLLRFVTETVQVSHIMVATQAEAEAIRQELLAGKDFAGLARARSQDEGSAEKGGDLGPIATGQADPEFEAVAFRLKEGELSEVVQTEHGYHVLKGGPRSAAVRPFEDVREEVRRSVAQGKQQEALQKVLAELEQGAAPEILDERFK